MSRKYMIRDKTFLPSLFSIQIFYSTMAQISANFKATGVPAVGVGVG
jgi:hypothetical protein